MREAHKDRLRMIYAGTGGVMIALVILGCVYASRFTSAVEKERKDGSDIQAAAVREEGVQPYRLENSFIRSLAPQLITGGFLLILLARITSTLSKDKSPRIGPHALRAENGTSAVEFILVFPLLLIILLTILQIALIVQAKFVVNYAAFCAARSAIVTIPARVGSGRITENHNVIYTNNPDSPKMKIIQRSAALPCVGISPRWSPGLSARTLSSTDPSPGVQMLKLALFVPHVDYVEQLGLRALYAYDRKNTQVEITPAQMEFADHAEVTIKVKHRYYLTVPFADRLLGMSYIGGGFFRLGSARYLEISEQYTLLNEGEPLYPESQKERFGDSDLEIENY